MTKPIVVSQAQATSAAVAKVAGCAELIVASAISAHKAHGKLSDHVRSAFASPVPVLGATLSAVFVQLDSKLMPKGGHTDESRATWATIANSVATHVRNIWNKLPEDARPALCYIALDRANCTANVQVLAAPTVQQLKNALGHDQKAYNAAASRIHPAKVTPGGAIKNPAPEPAAKGVVMGGTDQHAPTGSSVTPIIEMARGLSISEKLDIIKALTAQVEAEQIARLEADEKKGKGATAKGKTTAKTRGESQKVAKRIGNARNGVESSQTEAEAGQHGTTVEIAA